MGTALKSNIAAQERRGNRLWHETKAEFRRFLKQPGWATFAPPLVAISVLAKGLAVPPANRSRCYGR